MDAPRDASRDAERARADARDRELVARAIAGEVGAFDTLVEIHQCCVSDIPLSHSFAL